MIARIILLALFLSGCSGGAHFAGVPLWSGAADAELQALARRAREGDQQALLELGDRYADGWGVETDLRRAEQLYMLAASLRGNGLVEAQECLRLVRAFRKAEAVVGSNEFAGELGVVQALRQERAADPAGVAAELGLEIRGPLFASGRFRYDSTEGGNSTLCKLMASIFSRNGPAVFQGCASKRFVSSSRHGSEAKDIFLLRYGNEFSMSTEYLIIAADYGYFYRVPFGADFGLPSKDELCGGFIAFDLIPRSGRAYRLIVSRAADYKTRRRQKSVGCK